MSDRSAAVMVPDAELDADRLLSEARGLRDDAFRARMAAAARELGRPEAASLIAEEMLAMGERRPLPSAQAGA
jgi:UDP-N-acetylglucosamine:LPS N-acetylglucosamine transferase